MSSKILIIVVLSVILAVVLAVVIIKKPSKDNYNGTDTTATPSTPISSLSYVVADQSGNLSVNENGYFDNLNANQSLSVNGNPGNVGDLLVSGGAAAPPMWTSGAMRYIASGSYTIPSGSTDTIIASDMPISTSDPSGSKTSLTLSNLNPSKTLLIFLSLHNVYSPPADSGGSFNIIPTLTSTGGSQTGTPLNGYMPVFATPNAAFNGSIIGGIQLSYSFISDSLKTGAGGNQILSFASDNSGNFDSLELWGPSTQSVVVFELQ